MKVNEYQSTDGGNRYALNIVVAPENEFELLDELRKAKEALLDWIPRRGSTADRVDFTLVASSQKRCQEPFFRFLGRPLDRSVLSSPSC